MLADIGDHGSSEIVDELAPGARTADAFNSITMAHSVAGQKSEATRVPLVSGDDTHAKELVGGLIGDFEFAPIDLGRWWKKVAGNRLAGNSQPTETSS